MTIEQLYEMLEKIPKTGAINLVRRRIIMHTISEMTKSNTESNEK
jgi:hypothetical protein